MRRLAAPLLLFLVCASFYWKLTLTDQYTFLDSPDLANLDFPRLQFQASAWRHSQLPLWDPLHWAGQPFLGQVTGAAYPANWLLGIFPFREGKLSITVVHWYLVLLHFQGALFCYWLCRDWKRSQTASVLGGIVFAFGGFLGSTDWPQILNGALWLPLIFLYLFRALRGERALFSAAMSGALVGVTWLSGHHEAPIYTSTAVAGVWVFACCAGPRRVQLVRLTMAAGLTAFLISAVQILPALEYAPLAKRWVGVESGPVGGNDTIPYSVHQHYSWTLASVPGIVTPRQPAHVDPFIGIVAFSLVLLGIYHGWRRPQVRLLAAIGAAGLLMALASSTFIHGLLYAAVPVFGKARVPARALVLFSFAVAPLAAYGFDALRRRRSPWLARTITGLAATGLLLYAASLAGTPATITALTATVAAALFAAHRAGALGPRLLTCTVLLLVLVEIGSVTGINIPSRVAAQRSGHIDRLYHHNDIAAVLRAQPQPIRVEVDDSVVPYNFGGWHGIQTLGGFAASATMNLLELERHRPRTQDLLGINYYVDSEPPRPGLELVADGSSGLHVYRNPTALPRAWIVHKASQVESYNALRARLESADFDPRTEALLLTAPPALTACAEQEPAQARYTSNPNFVRIDAKAACRGLLILADTYFPGWSVTIDGRAAPILETFGALRGVVIEPGEHRVEFTYRPASAVTGGACGLLGIAFLFWVHRRSRK